MICVFSSYFFDYRFEGVCHHHLPKSLTFSFNAISSSYVEKSFISVDEKYKSLNPSLMDLNMSELRIPFDRYKLCIDEKINESCDEIKSDRFSDDDD
jgi:hypothetical protein